MVSKKILNIYKLLEKLSNGEELYPQDYNLQEELEVDERTLRRYLDNIVTLYGNIVYTQKIKKEFSNKSIFVYKAIDRKKDVSKVLKFFIENSDDFDYIFQIILENDPLLLKEYEKEFKDFFQNHIHSKRDVFLFVTQPFEKFENNIIFKNLKNAVKNREYRNIVYQYDTEEFLRNAKCLKIVFMNNNWYLAIETEEKEFRFLRIAFIKELKYSQKISYQEKTLLKYEDFFKKIQNPFTLYKKFQKAHLKASKKVAKYFMPDKKPFFPSQQFIQKNSDGSVEFYVSFTNPMEILPFVKQWLPDIEIVSPQSLKEKIVKDLKTALKNIEN